MPEKNIKDKDVANYLVKKQNIDFDGIVKIPKCVGFKIIISVQTNELRKTGVR